MARYLCLKKCVWNRRAWNPKSRLNKDRIYSGELVPPESLFRKLGDTEKAPPVDGDKGGAVPLSAMLPKTPENPGEFETGNVPVIDDLL